MLITKSALNKYLIVRENVILTPVIDNVIGGIDGYFKDNPAEVFSGVRTPIQQLNEIRNYAIDRNIISFYKEFENCGLNDMAMIEGVELYCWQRMWSKLLNIGVIINPPLPAKLLFNYVVDGKNKMGQVIQQSSHIMGIAFDISGGKDGASQEMEIVKKIPFNEFGIRSYKYEPKQNCVHVTCL